MTPSVTVLTCIPSPYQVELWDAVAKHGAIRPQLIYVNRTDPARKWAVPIPTHIHLYLEDDKTARKMAAEWVQSSDLFVASWYSDRVSRALIEKRHRSGKPWVLWGERPGFSQWGLLSRLRRHWHLGCLRRSNSPIWGIGKWGVDGWRKEFGKHRTYINIPYFSDLSRFAPLTSRHSEEVNEVRFLYSGSLISRKGVDLLAEAFLRLASVRRDVRLELVGTGDMETALRSQLSKLGTRVRFSGFCDWSELPNAYHRNDIVLMPSRYDGWGMVVAESLAAGLPIIASDKVGAAQDLVQPMKNGWIVTAGSVHDLFLAMSNAANLSVNDYIAMSAAAITSIESHLLKDGVRQIEMAVFTTIKDYHG